MHYHIQLKLPNETTYTATTQFFVADDDLAIYKNKSLYAKGTMFQTPLATHNIYSSISPAAAELLTLKLEGFLVKEYAALVNLGLQGMEKSVQESNGPGGPGGSGGNQDRPLQPGGNSDQTTNNVSVDVSDNDEANIETNTAGTSGTTMPTRTVSLFVLGAGCNPVGQINLVLVCLTDWYYSKRIVANILCQQMYSHFWPFRCILIKFVAKLIIFDRFLRFPSNFSI